jgi:hypothetical protein
MGLSLYLRGVGALYEALLKEGIVQLRGGAFFSVGFELFEFDILGLSAVLSVSYVVPGANRRALSPPTGGKSFLSGGGGGSYGRHQLDCLDS